MYNIKNMIYIENNRKKINLYYVRYYDVNYK